MNKGDKINGEDVWQDREIRFDVDARMLRLIPGEVLVDKIDNVEDTKGNNGDRGVMRVTNLRLIWHASAMPRINLSIGYSTVNGISAKKANSKIRGEVESLYIMAKAPSTRFEFIFTALNPGNVRLFTTVMSIHRAYETTKMYRELKMRGAVVDENEQLRILPLEQQADRMGGVWNLSSDQGNLGVFIITNVRVVWYASMNPQYNVSIPYLQLFSCRVRDSKFGLALVLETTSTSGEYVLGFRIDPEEKLQQVCKAIQSLHKSFMMKPVFGVQVTRERPATPRLGATEAMDTVEDDVEVLEKMGRPDAFAAYFSDGIVSEEPRLPVFSEELGLAVEQLKHERLKLLNVGKMSRMTGKSGQNGRSDRHKSESSSDTDRELYRAAKREHSPPRKRKDHSRNSPPPMSRSRRSRSPSPSNSRRGDFREKRRSRDRSRSKSRGDRRRKDEKRRRGRSKSSEKDRKKSERKSKRKRYSSGESTDDLVELREGSTLGSLIKKKQGDSEHKKKKKKGSKDSSSSSTSFDDETPIERSKIAGLQAPSNGYYLPYGASLPNTGAGPSGIVFNSGDQAPSISTFHIPMPPGPAQTYSVMNIPVPPLMAQPIHGAVHQSAQNLPPTIASAPIHAHFSLQQSQQIVANIAPSTLAEPVLTHLPPQAPHQPVRRKRPTVLNAVQRPVHFDPWGVGFVEQYDVKDQVGEGTYGQVYKAVNKFSGEQVALKKVRLENEKEGFPISAVREIKILRQLDHKNIVRLINIVTDKTQVADWRHTKNSFYLVFEYVDHDLMGLLESHMVTFTDEQIAGLFKQLLEGLEYCHAKNFLHRDIKCSNILVNNKGELKLADFGLARLFLHDVDRPYTNRVITLWYRPPELLLGEEKYGPSVDVWSVGCILGELYNKKPLFQGQTEQSQLDLITKICGSPTPQNWPDVANLPLYPTFIAKRVHPRNLKTALAFIPRATLELLDKLLALDPKKRPTCSEALRHPFVANIDPNKVKPLSLPIEQDCHELWSKRLRKERCVQALQQELKKKQE
ncbi:unnamed protein product, partial [Mesorhabditis belari]|uniref:Cyclin-dependent kinase 12 n=1 Tax=Mesorhabditis belari TaxID=2138241 RepID=A0AAF3E844_9BILA